MLIYGRELARGTAANNTSVWVLISVFRQALIIRSLCFMFDFYTFG